MPPRTLDDLPTALSNEPRLPAHSCYPLTDTRDGHADIVRVLVAEHWVLLFTAFRARLRARVIPRPSPLMTPGETDRLLVRRTFMRSELRRRPYQDSGPATTDVDLLFRQHTLLRLVTHFGPPQACLSMPVPPLHLVPWTVLHPFVDLLELSLTEHHPMVQCLPPYRKDDGVHFWQAREFHPDSLIPARLCKTFRRPS